MLSGLLIWFLHTYGNNGSCVFFFFFFFVFFVCFFFVLFCFLLKLIRLHSSQIVIFQYFSNKYKSEYNFG